MKQFFTLLCALALVLFLFPATAFAAGEGNMDSGAAVWSRALPPIIGPRQRSSSSFLLSLTRLLLQPYDLPCFFSDVSTEHQKPVNFDVYGLSQASCP